MKRFNWALYSLLFFNLLPIIGVLFYNWDIFPVIYIYFLETVVIGFFGLLKIIVAEGQDYCYEKSFIADVLLSQIFPYLNSTSSKGAVVMSYFISSIIFYGILFGLCLLAFTPQNLALAWNTNYLIIVLGLIISHGISFFQNYIGRKEYYFAVPYGEMIPPFDRVLMMFLVFASGAFTIYQLDSSILLLVALIVLKIIFDIIAHYQDHHRFMDVLENYGLAEHH